MAKSMKKNGEPRKPAAPRIAAETFVTEWQKADSKSAAVAKLGPGAPSRAKRLRDAGVKLKAFPREGGKVDVKALNALISA